MPWRAAARFCHFRRSWGVGVPPIQANATNTVALWPGQFTSIAAYWQDLKANLRLVLPVCSAALLGGVTGAIILRARPSHIYGVGALAVAARLRALCRQRPCLRLAAAPAYVTAASAPASSRCGLGL